MLNAVVLKPLAYGDPDRIVTLELVSKTSGRGSRRTVLVSETYETGFGGRRASLSSRTANWRGTPRATQLDDKLLKEIAAIPGISAVGSLRLPPGKPFSIGDYWTGRLPGPETQQVSAQQAVFSPVAPGTFAALGIPLKRGRDFNDSDTYEAPFTAVINETLARKSFPGQDPNRAERNHSELASKENV